MRAHATRHTPSHPHEEQLTACFLHHHLQQQPAKKCPRTPLCQVPPLAHSRLQRPLTWSSTASLPMGPRQSRFATSQTSSSCTKPLPRPFPSPPVTYVTQAGSPRMRVPNPQTNQPLPSAGRAFFFFFFFFFFLGGGDGLESSTPYQ